MTADEFAKVVHAEVRRANDVILHRMIQERITGPGRDYEQDPDTQAVETKPLLGLVMDVREEIVDGMVYASALSIRGSEQARNVIFYLYRAWDVMNVIETDIRERTELD